MFIRGIGFVLLTLVNHALGAAEQTSAIFQVDFSTDESGGCSYVGEANMNNYIQECLTLANAGVQLMKDYGPANLPAKRLVDALFKAADPGVVTADVLRDAKSTLSALSSDHPQFPPLR
jgi:hypothetical protein